MTEAAAAGPGSGATAGDGARSRPGAGRTGRARRPVAPDLYGVVLVLLAVCYVLFAVTTAVWAQVVTAALTVSALVLAVRTSRPSRRLQRTVQVVAGGGLVVTVGALVVLPRADALGIIDVTFALVLLFTLVVVLARVLEQRTVTLRSIAAALSGYLLIGMCFTHVFGVIAWLDPPFFAGDQVADGRALQYFSFTTLTTLGYGDLTAAGYAGRGLATFEALVGQVFLVTIVARLVASWRGPGAGAPTTLHDEAVSPTPVISETPDDAPAPDSREGTASDGPAGAPRG
ncbi:two pore domain potassium channel family protein [Cellulomonas sp. DKR-3]|uniref:Two pore domain potassium channel family protein n=1 Tax=Cellulomonas fulva TaxID=2835530 RepID=A0ABS5U0L5_9CELL|nr:potassium channel family protein [Cellulomonas fulva]MBT0994952.1 two pore domain potassium channel family protein [Cellulomonas fulva]